MTTPALWDALTAEELSALYSRINRGGRRAYNLLMNRVPVRRVPGRVTPFAAMADELWDLDTELYQYMMGRS